MRVAPEPHLVPTPPVRPTPFTPPVSQPSSQFNRTTRIETSLEHPTLRNTTRLTKRTEMNHAKPCLLNHLEHRSPRESSAPSSAPRAHRSPHPWLVSVPHPHPRATNCRSRTLQALCPALERVVPIPSPQQHSCRLTKRSDTNLHNLLDENRLEDDAQEQSSAPEAHRRAHRERTAADPRRVYPAHQAPIVPKQVPQTAPISTLPASQHPAILGNNRFRKTKNVSRNKRTRLLTNPLEFITLRRILRRSPWRTARRTEGAPGGAPRSESWPNSRLSAEESPSLSQVTKTDPRSLGKIRLVAGSLDCCGNRLPVS